MPMKELMIDYIPARLMHKMSKRKEKKSQGEDTAMMLQQSKGGN